MKRNWYFGLLVFVILTLSLCGCGGSNSNGTGSYTVSGQITFNSSALQGVSLSFNNGTSSVTTDANGNWNRTGLSGTVIVTPSMAGYTFTPTTFTVSAARSDVNFTATRINVAYIYNSLDATDTTVAGNFKTFLDPTFPTVLIAKSNIVLTDYSNYSVIIIGRETLLLTTEQWTKIKDTNLPVIGINRGGTGYFGNISLTLNGGNVASNPTNEAIVINSALSVWSFPNALSVSNDSKVTLFNSISPANTFVKANLGAGGIHIAGCNPTYDTIAQVGNNLYWAYSNDASDFTAMGEKLFINIVQYMAQLK